MSSFPFLAAALYLVLKLVLPWAVYRSVTRPRRGLLAGAAALLVLAVLVVLPLGDHLLAYVRFIDLCDQHQGTMVLERAGSVQAIRVEELGAEWAQRAGYRVVEERNALGRPLFYSTEWPGSKGENLANVPIRYELRTEVGLSEESPAVSTHRFLIVDIDTGQVLARQQSYLFLGGWLWRSLSSVAGGMELARCVPSRSIEDQIRFVRSVLIPFP